jgi:hypothetical protein
MVGRACFTIATEIDWSWDMNEQTYDFRFKLKYDYAAWIEQILNGKSDDQIWNGYIVTFMYNHIPGPFDHKCSVMENEIERVYATLINHVVHNSRSPSQRKKLPKLYAFPDYPRKKMDPFRWEDVMINDGLHYHGIILIPIDTRLKISLDMFINEEKNEKTYRHLVKFGGPLRRIHIKPVDRTPQKVAGYAFKSIEWRIPDSNKMLILPKAVSELPDKGGRG